MARKSKELKLVIDQLFAETGASIKPKKKANDGISLPSKKQILLGDEEITKQFFDTYEPKIGGNYGVTTEEADAEIMRNFEEEQSSQFVDDEKGKVKKVGNFIVPTLTAIDMLIPGGKTNRQTVVKPQTSFNTSLYGKGSQAIMKSGGTLGEEPKKLIWKNI